jgi:hypothetical protein
MRFAFIFGRAESTCWWCHEYVDRRLKFPDPMSPTIDHLKPPTTEREFFAVSGWRLCHFKCNLARGRSGALPPHMNRHTAPVQVWSNPGAEHWNDVQRAAQEADSEWRGYRSSGGRRQSREW